MAFDQQLEADRVDDFNLFSVFARVPLLILEGVLGQQKSQQESHQGETTMDDSTCERSTLPKETKRQDRIVSSGSMSPNGTTKLKPLSRLEGKLSNSLSRRSSHTSLVDLIGSADVKRNRQTSWSDESGLSLVEYLDESVKHEPNSPYDGATSTKAPVVKSAMKRSRSIRNNSMGGAEKRYIPNMKQASNGLVMPTRPYHGKDSPPTGEFSPQWGWYTSLTPPDVGMYSKGQHKRSASEPARPLKMYAFLMIWFVIVAVL
ncbi:MAG: hypothetical protein SGBAC_005083 [Bacillariaceae sp.]